jgi:hypothetical protein
MKSDVPRYLVEKLASQLNEPSIKGVPWSEMKAGDIMNWPSDLKFISLYKMKAKELRRLYELTKEDRLYFSPEFLRITGPKTHYRNELTKYLADKLALRLNASSIQVPWSKMKAEDVVSWPPDLKFRFMDMTGEELRKLHQLVKEDKLDFSPKFLSRFKNRNPRTRYDEELRSNVAKYLKDKLSKKLNLTSATIPWSKMKEDDIINWPSDVKFIRVGKMNGIELQKLNQLTREDILDFSPKFLSQYKTLILETHKDDEIRSEVTKYLKDKLAKKLNLSSITVLPWSKMKAEDLLNWPREVDFIPFYNMKAADLKAIHKVVTEDQLDFSPKFLNRYFQDQIPKHN